MLRWGYVTDFWRSSWEKQKKPHLGLIKVLCINFLLEILKKYEVNFSLGVLILIVYQWKLFAMGFFPKRVQFDMDHTVWFIWCKNTNNLLILHWNKWRHRKLPRYHLECKILIGSFCCVGCSRWTYHLTMIIICQSETLSASID